MEDVPLVPRPGYALIELGQSYEHIKVQTKAYEAASNGKCVALGSSNEKNINLLGRRVYWSAAVAPAPITKDNKQYIFIKVNQIEGSDAIKS